MGVFKEDKMIGKLTEGQVKGFVWVMGDLSNMKLTCLRNRAANAKCSRLPIVKAGA